MLGVRRELVSQTEGNLFYLIEKGKVNTVDAKCI